MLIPRYLFHWTSANALSEIARAAAPGGSFPLAKTIPAASMLSRCYPQLRRRPALYGWSHPVTGMASSPSVVYARAAQARSVRLLALELKPAPSVLRLSTPRPCRERFRIDRDLDDIDLIYHEIRIWNGSLVREWVVLKAGAISRFTADVGPALRGYLARETRRLGSQDYDYPEEVQHSRSAGHVKQGAEFFLSITSIPRLRKTIVLPRLRAVARLRAREVPPPLRRPFPVDVRRFAQAAFGRTQASGKGSG